MMDKERFSYLLNTLPWNLSPEDRVEQTAINEQVIPIALGYLFDKYPQEPEIKDNK